MLAEEAAIKLHRERGYVVIGFTDVTAEPAKPGDWQTTFAGGNLSKHRLVVEQETSRTDWDDQVRHIFGAVNTPRNPQPAMRQKFYRCRLELRSA